MKNERRDKVLSLEYGSNISSPLARLKGASTSDELYQSQKYPQTTQTNISKQIQQQSSFSPPARCSSSQLSRILNSTTFQLIIMIMIPELFLIMISIALAQANLIYSAESVSSFSLNLYEQSIYFVKLQDAAVQMSLASQMQNEAVLLQIMHSLQYKALRGKVEFNPAFQKPVLNIESTHANIGDPYLLQLFRKNLTLLISSWHQKDALEVTQLDSFSQEQIYLASRIDFVLRSALRTNRLEITVNPYAFLVFQYFYPFGHDGMYFSTGGTNMTFSTFVDLKPCTSGKYNLDLRCRPYYLATKNKDIMTVFPPMVFYGGTDSLPYTSSGICKRQAVPLSMADEFQVSSLNNGVYSLVCNSIRLEQISLLFERFKSDPRVLIMLVEPVSMRLVYSSGVKMKQGEVLTLQGAYLSQLDSPADQAYFLEQIQSYAAARMAPFCYAEGQETIENQEDMSFHFKQKSGEIVVFINHLSSSDISQIHVDDVYGENSPYSTLDTGILNPTDDDSTDSTYKRRRCISSYWMFLTVIPKDQLLEESHFLEEKMETINTIFQSITYIALIVSVMLFSLYLKKMSYMMNAPITHLTKILKEANVYEAVSAANHLCEEEINNLFYSSDARVLFESFRRLFDTLGFATQSMFGENQCQTLLNLNKQILHFKQLRNYRALGVCYNNIGNIHYNSKRYMEGLESYQTAIVYIQYELQVYQEILDAGENQRTSLSINKIKFKDMFQGIRQIKQYFFETQQSVASNATKTLLPNNTQIFNESELQELYWILYNRKQNYMKSLIGLMAEGKSVIDWETVKCLADELQDISRNKLHFCPKRQILINHSEMLIHYQTKDVQNCMRLLTENKLLLQSLKLNKATLAKKIKTKKRIKQRGSQDSILNSSIINPKIDEIKNDLTGNQNASLGGNLNIFVKQRNSIFGDGSSATTKKSYGQKIQGNSIQIPQIRGTSYSNSDPKTNSVNMLLGEKNDQSALSKSNLNIHQAPLLEEASFFLGKQQSNFNSGQNLMGTPSVTPKNEEIDSPLDKIGQVTNLQSDRSSPKSKQKDQQLESGKFVKSLFLRKDQVKSDNRNHNPEPFQQSIQKNPRKSKLSAIKVSESLRNINISKQLPSQGNNESQQLDSSQASLYQDNLAKSNNINQIESSLFSVQSQNKFNRIMQDSIQLEQKKQKRPTGQKGFLDLADSLFGGVICEEEGTVLLLQGKKYNSASVFTSYFEETRQVLHFIQSQVLNKLSFIFSEVGLRDNELERLAFNYEYDASFKITVFVFAPGQTLEDEKVFEKQELLGERVKQQQQLLFQQQSMRLDNNGEIPHQNVQDEILLSEKENIENKKQFSDIISQLCTDIVDKVIFKPDDMLGVIVATDPWVIQQQIEMLSSKFFKQNSDFLELVLQNLISNQHSCLDSFKEHHHIHAAKGDASKIANGLNNNNVKQIDQLGNFVKQRIQEQGNEDLLGKKDQTLSMVISPENDLQISPSAILETFGTQQCQQKEKLSSKHSRKRKLGQNLEQKTEVSFDEKKDFLSQNGQKTKVSKLLRSLSVVSERRKYSESKSNSDAQSSNFANLQLKIEKPSNNLKQIECKEMLLLSSEQQQKSDNDDQQEEGDVEEELDSEGQMSSTQKQKNTTEINTLDNKIIKDNDDLLISSEGSTIRDQIMSSSQSNKSKVIKFLERSKSQEGLKYFNQASSKEITLCSFQDVANGIGNRLELLPKLEKHKDLKTIKSQEELAKQPRSLLVSKTLSKPLMKSLDKDTRSVLEISRGSSCSKSVSESSPIFFSTDSSNQSFFTSPSQSSSYGQQNTQTSQDLRVLFLMGVRRALQSVLLSGGESSRIDSLMKIAETKGNQGNQLEMLRKTRKLNHFLLHKKQSKQIFKKFAVVLTNSISFIKPNDSVLILLYQQFMRFSVQLYILCLNKEQAIQFQQQIPVQYIDIVIVFISEESLIEHLLFSRSSTSYHFYPITVEHF